VASGAEVGAAAEAEVGGEPAPGSTMRTRRRVKGSRRAIGVDGSMMNLMIMTTRMTARREETHRRESRDDSRNGQMKYSALRLTNESYQNII